MPHHAFTSIYGTSSLNLGTLRRQLSKAQIVPGFQVFRGCVMEMIGYPET